MNKELREILDDNNVVIKKITIKNSVIIIESVDDKFVIKRIDNDLLELFKYLKGRSFNNFPDIIYKTANYYVYRYIDGVKLSSYEKSIDIMKLLTVLHSKTTYYKDIDEDDYKKIYEGVIDRINYLYNYYGDISDVFDKDIYMSPSHYLFMRNISLVFQILKFSRINIDKWVNIIKDKLRVRIVNIHNNLSLSHYILSDKPYFISWNLSKKDMPIYDIINFYKKYYDELDFSELLRIYESHYPLLPEERLLLFSLIAIPSKLEFNDYNYDMCKKIDKFYKYITCSFRLFHDFDNIKGDKNE